MSEYKGEGNGVATTLAATLGGGGLLAGLGSLAMNFLQGTAENIAGGYYRPGGAGIMPAAAFAGETVILRDEVVRRDAIIEIEKVRSENALLKQEIGFEKERRVADVHGVYDFIKSHYVAAKKYIDSADVGTLSPASTTGAAA